jgi:hypothetical protein
MSLWRGEVSSDKLKPRYKSTLLLPLLPHDDALGTTSLSAVDMEVLLLLRFADA